MEKASMVVLGLIGIVVLMATPINGVTHPVNYKGLVRKFYNNTCRDIEAIVKHQIHSYMVDHNDMTIAPKLARLLYSDCFVGGCDASILLIGDDSERKAPQNLGLGGFAIIDKIKEVAEKECPGVVSCADILSLATRDAIKEAGGPSYVLPTGRRDGLSSKSSSVNLPSSSISIDELLKYFQTKGLTPADTTAVLGLHSMGSVRCRYIVDRLYNFKGTGKSDPSIDAETLADLKKKCPKTKKKGDHEGIIAMNPDSGSKYALSNTTFTRISNYKAVMGVDQQLMYNSDTIQLVQEFSDNMQDFKLSLALAMYKMNNIGVLTGSDGEIRSHCGYTNKDNPYLK